jgi:putative ABC transport system permease protein
VKQRASPSARRLVNEAMAGVVQKSSKSLLTVIGTALGIGAFISVLGVTASANGQITQDFNALTATQFQVQPTDIAAELDGSLYPADAEERIRALNGVVEAFRAWEVPTEGMSSLPREIADSAVQARVMAASPSYWAATNAELSSGRVFDDALRGEAVAIVGEDIARRLGAAVLGEEPIIYIDGEPVSVIGILASSATSREAVSSIVIPDDFARTVFGNPGVSERLTVHAELGTRSMLLDQLALAIDPAHPEWFKVTPPPAPTIARNQVSESMQTLFIALAAITLFVGAVGTTNSSLIGVMSRVPEIGLRRALGALPRHIAAQFLLESAIRGLLGGAIGAMAGLTVIIGVSLARGWTPIFDLWMFLLAPVFGMLLGAAAGLYPALRAARIEPVEAFRQ